MQTVFFNDYIESHIYSRCLSGLVYMVFKHLVDRYNLYFAYKPSHISPNIHYTAVNFVLVAVLFVQFNFVFFSVLRGSKWSVVLFYM